MRLGLSIHILAGVVGLLSGFTSLFAAKGARLHRQSGNVFVWSMLIMGVSGAVLAAIRGVESSVVAGTLTA